MRYGTTLGWLVLTTAGCGRTEQTFEEREDAWLAKMDEIDGHAVRARDAVAHGDLGEAKAAARKLRDALPTEDVPVGLVRALDDLDAAKTPRDAAKAMADLSVGCLGCHAAKHASLAMRERQWTPPTGGTVPAEMLRHQKFVDGVWVGLIGGDDTLLREASQILDQGHLVAGMPMSRQPGFLLTAAGASIDERVHALAHELRDAPGDRRPPLFAELLGTCADCHALAKAGALTKQEPTPANPAMNDHFVDLLTLELAVIGGDVPAARKAAAAVAEATIEAPPAAAVHVRALDEAAERTMRMDTLPSLALGTAEMMATCGRCHAATGGGPKAPVEPAPAADAPEMTRHLYGSFWLGQSLLTGDEAAWVAGASVLAASGLGPLVADPAVDATVHDLGKRAERAKEPAERTKVFGELLATCHPCHQQLNR
jgi:hypothetical protein